MKHEFHGAFQPFLSIFVFSNILRFSWTSDGGRGKFYLDNADQQRRGRGGLWRDFEFGRTSFMDGPLSFLNFQPFYIYFLMYKYQLGIIILRDVFISEFIIGLLSNNYNKFLQKENEEEFVSIHCSIYHKNEILKNI